MPMLRPTAMISSTSRDLPKHREAVMDTCIRLDVIPRAMEYLTATADGDAIDASLRLVDDGDIYILILAHRYGYRPKDARRNPQQVSITELEYRHAKAAHKHMLIFIMGDDHDVKAKDIEMGDGQALLTAFRDELLTNHVVAFYNSIAELENRVMQALIETLPKIPLKPAPPPDPTAPKLPIPPALYVKGSYTLGGTPFVGRSRELETLHAWGPSSDAVMIVEGIGGLGKSALTWTWIHEHAAQRIPNLGGIVWWSFYEQASTIRSLVSHTLAYITHQDPDKVARQNPDRLKDMLIAELKRRPYLIVFDGFERALVAYHRWRAEYMTEEEVSAAERQAALDATIRSCTDPADGEFLSRLVDCAPSKFLFSTRLYPTHFNDRATRQPLRGVQHIALNGLAPQDAYDLLRAAGVSHATRRTVDDYLERFGYHSLLVKVVAGQVNEYIAAPGNFDQWVREVGATIRLSELDLRQRQSNILAYAFDGLTPDQQRLLGQVAAFSDAVPYQTLADIRFFEQTGDLFTALRALTERGLLQWDKGSNSYDLHPIVRAFAFERIGDAAKVAAYERLHQHFSSLPAEDTANATELAQIRNSIEIYLALLGAGRWDEAARFYVNRLLSPIKNHIAAYAVGLRLLRPLFRDGEDHAPALSDKDDQSAIMTTYASLLAYTGQREAALHMQGLKIKLNIEMRHAENLGVGLQGYAISLKQLNRLAAATHVYELSRDLARAARDHDGLAKAHLYLLSIYTDTGQWQAADDAYAAFSADPPYSQRDFWRAWAEAVHAQGLVMQDLDARAALERADELAARSHNSLSQRVIARWWGEAALNHGDAQGAVEHFRRAAQMAQQHGAVGDARLFVGRLAVAYALLGDATQAKYYLAESGGDIANAAEVAWHLGEHDQARRDALRTYKWAWLEGPPYVEWFWLQKAKTILEAVGEPLPEMPPFDPAKVAPFEYEAEVRAFITELEAKRRG